MEMPVEVSFQELVMAANRVFARRGVVVRTCLPLLTLVGLLVLAGCPSTPIDPIDPRLYASGTTYTYQPLNPTTVWVRDPTQTEQKEEDCGDADETCYEFNKALLHDLDTETVRVSLDTLNGSLDISGGVVGASVKGQSYVLIVDYIKYITSRKEIDTKYVSLDAHGQERQEHFQGTVPMYTGVGLRVRAEFLALQGGLNVSGLPALAVAASVDGISGRLTVQTLGISGPEVTSLVPLISDISVTSIQNAVQAVAAIKAKIYEETTTVYPKIVGFESPSRDPALIRALTGAFYASDEYICPVTIKNPQDDTKRILSICWFSPPPEEDDGQGQDEQPETPSP
jgi:hypothetical protein